MVGPRYQLRDLSRASEILRVLARHGFGSLVSSLPLDKVPGLRRPETNDDASAKVPAGQRLVEACQELGPSFVKFGQMLSTRPDILPPDWIEAFEQLQDQVQPFDGAIALQRVEEGLGAPVDVLFSEFSTEPVASASIAQVHAARLLDGTRVAVKVQRPGIEKTIRSDINIMYILAEMFEGRIDLGVYTPRKIVEAFDGAISREVDFLNEAANGKAFLEALDGLEGVAVPAVYRTHVCRTILTMEWIDGKKLSDISDTGADRKLIMDRLVEASFQQLFVHGIFHADPHPGNLVVDDDSVLTFLDFGLMGRVTPDMRDTLEGIFVGVIFRDADLVARTIYRAGSAEERVNLRDLSSDVEVLIDRWGGTTFDEQDTSRIAQDILDLAKRHRLKLPEEYAILARTEVTLDGIARGLIPDWDPMEAVKPYAARLAADRFDPQKVGGDLVKQMVSMSAILRDVPGQLDQILLDLEQGNFHLEARTPSVDRLNGTIDRIGRALVFGLGISAFLVSASYLIGSILINMAAAPGVDPGSLFVGALAFMAGSAAALLLGGLTWNLFVRDILARIRWSRFFGLIPFVGRLFRKKDPKSAVKSPGDRP
ncbi:MAG: AarF/ABC1/UbiB kinase family protein [Myxococcota bacterium]|nr:AarF/ABC1/UbiB kinase family protein [Myxococcota bacterium]